MASQTSDHAKDAIYDHKWGFKDTKFVLTPERNVTVTGNRYDISGTEMPGLMPFVEEMLDIKLDYDNLRPELQDKPVPSVIENEGFLTAVKKTFPDSQYSQDGRQRLIHSHGQTTADELNKVLYDKIDRVADLIFYPESEEDAAKIIALAQAHDVCLVPYGGGTSVSSALRLPIDETRMIVSIDTRRMNKIEWIDKENFLASIEAGITGKDMEEALAKEGFTSGHEPDSLELSTLGGWIATNASGMKKNKYGNIEQAVENVTMISPNGVVRQLATMPRSSMGMQPQSLLFGSEGNLGLITKATIRIHKLPEVTKFASFVFPDFKAGTDFLYDLMQTGTLPASVRLLDNGQFRFGSALKPTPTFSDELMNKLQKFVLLNVKKFNPVGFCAATVVMEGTAVEVNYQNKLINKLAKRHNGMAGGAGNGKRGYNLTYAIAYLRDFFADFYVIAETYETTVPWSKIHSLIEIVTKEALEMHKAYNLPGTPYVAPRVTQLYHTGVCIYFMHAFSTQGVENPSEILSAIDKKLRQTILDNGGSVSHHHGIGKLRKEFMSQTMTPASVELLKQVKVVNDPSNVFGIGNNVFAE